MLIENPCYCNKINTQIICLMLHHKLHMHMDKPMPTCNKTKILKVQYETVDLSNILILLHCH